MATTLLRLLLLVFIAGGAAVFAQAFRPKPPAQQPLAEPKPPAASVAAQPVFAPPPTRAPVVRAPAAQPAATVDLAGAPASHFEAADLESTDDALTIRFHTGRVRLAGLEDLPRTTVCLSEGQMWACGQQARAALFNLIRGRDVLCQAGRRVARDLVEAACSAEGQDLAMAQVAAGWARPSAPGAMDQAMAQAKTGGRGLWHGGWTLRPPLQKAVQ